MVDGERASINKKVFCQWGWWYTFHLQRSFQWKISRSDYSARRWLILLNKWPNPDWFIRTNISIMIIENDIKPIIFYLKIGVNCNRLLHSTIIYIVVVYQWNEFQSIDVHKTSTREANDSRFFSITMSMMYYGSFLGWENMSWR